MIISDEAFEYLRVQQGALDAMSNNRDTWERAYEAGLQATVQSFASFIPDPCERILDVGSGLGGINILLHRITKAEVWLLDGLADGPEMKRNYLTHNSMTVARKFLEDNGVNFGGCFAPDLTEKSARGRVKPPLFELVVSLSAWCFHFPPITYLHFVADRLRRGGRLVVDVRADRADYDRELADELRLVAVALTGRKFERRVYERA